MPEVKQTEILIIPDAGATIMIDSTLDSEWYIFDLTQTGTMSGNTSISDDGASLQDSVYTVEFPGGMILGGQTCTIFGTALTDEQALNPCLIVARWDGAAFQTQVYTDWSADNTVLLAHMNDDSVGTSEIVDDAVNLAKMAAGTQGGLISYGAGGDPFELAPGAINRFLSSDGPNVGWVLMSNDATLAGGILTISNDAITTAKILDTAVTFAKQQALAQGNIVRGSAAAVHEAYDVGAIGAGAVVMTDGTDVLAQLFSGDATVSGAGAVTISAGLNTFITKVTIPTGSVLTGNSIPITLVGAPGAAKYIRPIACINTLTFNSVAYATNGEVQLRHETASDPCMTVGTSFLFGTVTHTSVMVENEISAVTNTQLIVNKALLWEVDIGDPTAGDSEAICYLIYQIIDV